jgi:hypothetical protein
MKKIYFAVYIFFLLISTSLFCEDSYLYGKYALEIKDELSDFFPREENSLNEKKLFSYLENKFREIGTDFKILNYSLLEKGHSFSKGYSITIDGDSRDTMVIVVPLNNKKNQNSIRDGSINIAIAIQLLDIFSKYNPPISLEFLFLGAERGTGSEYPIGTRYFLSNFAAKYPTMILYLDMDKEGDLLTLKNSSNDDLTPLWLVEQFSELFIQEGLEFSTDSVQTLAYQSGFEASPSIMNQYLKNEIPALVIESRISTSQTFTDYQWANSFIETILSFVLNNHEGFEKEWDRHYFISLFNKNLITMGEKEGISIMLSLLAILLLILLIRSRNLHLNLKRFRKHLWTFPLLLFLTFMYLFLSTLIIEEISYMHDFPTLWQQYPIQFLLFKICAAIFLYSGFIFFVRGLSISRSHHFYTYSAFASVLISMVIVLLYNINFSYFFLWSLVIVSIFMTSRNEVIKRIAIGLSPLPLLILGYNIFSYPYLRICEFLLVSRVSGNIFLTIIIMPTLMLISSLNYYHHRFYRHRRSLRNVFNLLFWGSLTLLVLYNINSSSPYSIFKKQPVYVDEKIDLNSMSRSILFNSPAPMGDIVIELDEQKLRLSDVRRSAEITAPMLTDLLEITEDYSTFLDRMKLNYKITAKGKPEYINIKLLSEKPLIIYDSNFPYEVTADSKEIDFYIGKNPEMPLSLSLILPRGSVPLIRVGISYIEFPYSFHLTGNELYAEKKLSVLKDIEWKH